MRSSLKNTLAASLAALTIGLTLVNPAPASAHNWHPGGFHGHHGFWGPGLALGVFGLAASAVAYSSYEDNCIEYRPTYDRWGNYMGRQPVNVCQ
jgi:hypothetical protein